MIRNYFAQIPEIDYSDFRMLVEDVTSRCPGNIAFRMRAQDESFREMNYAEAYRQIRTVAAYLLHSGIGKGDRVGLISENRMEWTIAYLAAVYAGIIVVPFDIHTSKDGLTTYASFAELSAILYSDKYREPAAAMADSCPSCSLRVCFDGTAQETRRKREISFKDIIDNDELLFQEIDLPDLEAQDPAAIIFTSGTTGSPKGVTLSHHGIIANVNASIMSLPIDEHDNFVAVLPFHHTYPTTCSFISPYTVGGSVTIVDKIAGPRMIADIRDAGGTILIGVPLLFDKLKKGIEGRLRQLPPVKRTILDLMRGLSRMGSAVGLPLAKILFRGLRQQAGLASVRLLVSGGGPLSAATADFFQELGFTIVQGYGMSENGPLITTNTVKYYDNRSAGLPVKHTDMRIASPDGDGIGEIEVASPSLMLGYFRNPEATGEAFTPDGYLRTGDLGYINDKGFLFISGRSKNMIVTAGGKNVFPEEMEALFPDKGPIGEVMVMGRKMEHDRGERIIAVCVPDYEYLEEEYKDRTLSDEDIESLIRDEISALNRSLESYRKIEQVFIRREPFEKTASDKIKRFLYREYAEAAPD